MSFFALILFLLLSLSKTSHQFNHHHPLTMPAKRNLSLSPPSPSLSSPPMAAPRNKKLRRLPHVFSKVLELPFDSEADVSVEDRPDCLRFLADGESFYGEVRTHVVEVHPGVTKVVIRRRESGSHQLSVDNLELNLWRFRLPAVALPEMATAAFSGGKLVVTVPKNGWRENMSCVEDCKGGGSFRGNMGTLVLVE